MPLLSLFLLLFLHWWWWFCAPVFFYSAHVCAFHLIAVSFSWPIMPDGMASGSYWTYLLQLPCLNLLVHMRKITDRFSPWKYFLLFYVKAYFKLNHEDIQLNILICSSCLEKETQMSCCSCMCKLVSKSVCLLVLQWACHAWWWCYHFP